MTGKEACFTTINSFNARGDRAIAFCRYRDKCPDAKDFDPSGSNKPRDLNECKRYREYQKGQQGTISPIQDRIRTFAFQNGCDFDEATMRVLREILNDASLKRTQEGLYDSLFVSREEKPAK